MQVGRKGEVRMRAQKYVRQSLENSARELWAAAKWLDNLGCGDDAQKIACMAVEVEDEARRIGAE